MINLLNRNDKSVTAHNEYRKSHRRPQCTLQLVHEAECCSSELIITFPYVGSKVQKASEQFDWCIHHSFFNPLKTKRRLLYLKTQFVPRSEHFSSRL